MGLSTAESKDVMRKRVLDRRDAIEVTDREARSLKLCQRVQDILERHFELNGHQNSTGLLPLVGLYNAMKSEIDLEPLAQELEKNSWRVCYPIMLKKDEFVPSIAATQTQSKESDFSSFACFNTMAFFSATNLLCEDDTPSASSNTSTAQEILSHPLRRHSFSELERAGLIYVSATEIDALIVPLVAFDGSNHRLGYGGGNYDNYLPALRSDCLVMGVAFEEQCVEAVPLEAHDLPLPSIVTC